MNATRRIGIRPEVRGYFTFAGGGSTVIGCGGGGCSVGFAGDVFFQMDLSIGVVLGPGRT